MRYEAGFEQESKLALITARTVHVPTYLHITNAQTARKRRTNPALIETSKALLERHLRMKVKGETARVLIRVFCVTH